MQNETAQSTVHLNGEQAKSELTALAQKAKNLSMMLKEANEAGDGKAFEKYSKQLRETNKQMKQMAKEAFDVKKVLDNLSGASIKDLVRAQKELDKQLRSGEIPRNSKEWNQLRDSLKNVKSEIAGINNESKVGESRLSNFANGFNKYFAAATAALAAITGLTLGLKKFMDMRNELEDSKANLKALTGLEDGDIEWLTQQAAVLSTSMTKDGVRIRKSSKEIVDAFTVVGSAKPELLKNKDALKEVTEQAMILAEASKMELGDAVRGLTIAMNMYGASADKAAIYTNVLGAGAKEGAAEVSSQTESILKAGVAASQAGIPIQQLVGSIQALAEKGIKDEIAGTGLKSFFIKLQSGADATNPKVVGLQKALENLQKQNLSSADLQKRFGLETYTVAAAMIASADKVKYYTKAVTGTNTALEQARINSQTTAAKLAQAKNEFSEAGMTLVKNLNPAILSATNLTTKFIKVLVEVPGWLRENSGLIKQLAIAMGIYALAVSRAYIVSKAQMVLEKMKVAWTAATTAATLAQVAVTGYLTGATRVANLATKEFFATLGLNPFVAIGIAIAAVVIALYKWREANDENRKATKIYEEILADQTEILERNSKAVLQNKAELQSLVGAITSTNISEAQRSRLIDELNKKYPGFISFINKEKISNELLNAALSDVNEQYDLRLKNIAISAKSQAFENAAVKAMTRQLEIQERLNELRMDASVDHASEIKKLELEDAKLTADIVNYKNKANELKIGILENNAKSSEMNTASYYEGQMQMWKNALKDISKKRADAIADGNKEQASFYNNQVIQANAAYKYASLKFLKLSTDAKKNEKIITGGGASGNSAEVPNKKGKSPYELDLEQMELANKKMIALRKDFFAKEKSDEEDYQAWMYIDELQFLNDKLKLQEKYGEITVDTQIAISDLLIAEKKRLSALEKKEKKEAVKDEKKEEKDAVKELADFKERYGIDELGTFRNQKELELKILKDYIKKGLISEKDALKVRQVLASKEFDIRTKKAKETAQAIANITGDLSGALAGFQQAEENSITRKYQKQIDAAEKAGQDTTAIEEEKNKELAKSRAENADAAFALQVASIIASTAAAAIDAYASALKIPGVGLTLAPIAAAAAIAYGGSQIAIANSAREDAKAGYWTGGFTEPGDKYKPAGIVHAGEFVANQDAVGSVPMRKVFNLIDHAQRTNTVARITNEDIARAVGFRSGIVSTNNGAGASQTANNQAPIDLSSINATMAQVSAVNALLLSEIQKGIVAHASVSGKNGIAKATEDYTKLLNNVGK